MEERLTWAILTKDSEARPGMSRWSTKHVPASPPHVPQIPSKWQEQKHNNVLSNQTNDHTKPFYRKKDVLVKTQTTKLHLEGGSVASCRNCYSSQSSCTFCNDFNHDNLLSDQKHYD